MSKETTVAEGTTISTQRIRIATEPMNPMNKKELFVTIYSTGGNGTVHSLLLTPEEAVFVRDVLVRMGLK